MKITFPKNKQIVSGPTVMITGTASDKDSGIDKVQVKVDGGSYQDAIFSVGHGHLQQSWMRACTK